jgi:hypothetical protein
MAADQDETIYHEVSGGAELLRWFGRVPSFHDAEILSLDLRRKGQSTLRLHGWITTDKVGEGGFLVLERQAIVSFALDEERCRSDRFSPQAEDRTVSALRRRRLIPGP